MSNEKTEESGYTNSDTLPDDKVRLSKRPDGSLLLILKTENEADAKDRCSLLERIKTSVAHNESRQFNYLPPPTYKVTFDGSTVKITGDVDELEDAAETLYSCIAHISKKKMEGLVNELHDIRKKTHEAMREKELQERKAKQAKKEQSIREKYAPLVEKYGMDKNTAFESLSNAKTKPSTVSSKAEKKNHP